MISAFGVELGKSAEGEAARAAKLARRAARPRLSAEEIEHLRAQKAARISAGEATAPPSAKPKQDPNAQRREQRSAFFVGHQAASTAASTGVALAGYGTAHHLSKSHDKSAVAAGAVGGAAAANAVDNVAGAGLKRAADNARHKAGPLTETQRGTLRAHQIKHGMVDSSGEPRHPNRSSDSWAKKNRYYRHFPTELPGGRVQRINAVRDVTEGPATLAAGALVGAALVHHHNKTRVAKAHKRVAQAAVGAGAVGVGVTATRTQLADAHAARSTTRATGHLEQARAGHQAALKDRGPERAASIHASEGKLKAAKDALAAVPKRRRIVARGLLGAGLGLSAFGVAGAHALARKPADELGKADKRQVDDAAAGASAGAAGHVALGHALKPHRAEAVIRSSAEHQAVFAAHRKAVGVRRAGEGGSNAWTRLYREYPKELPGATRQRVLAHTHAGRTGTALQAAMTAGGLVGGVAVADHVTARRVARNKERSMAKSAFGVDHVAKAYQPGTITIHNEDARMHGRKKNSGYRQVAAGTAIGTGGVALHQNARPAARFLAEHSVTEGAAHEVKVARALVPKLQRVGVGAAIGGGALLGVGAARAFHHGRKQNQSANKAQAARRERNIELEERSMAKSAFGVEIGKLGPAKVHYREVTATRTKGNIASTYLPDSVETGYRGKSLILRRKKYDALGGPSNWTPRSGDLVARSPRYRVHHADARRLAHAHEKNTDTVELASGATLKHRNEVKKSAFLDEPVEKFALGAVLDAGRDALKGLQHGAAGKSFGSAPGATAGALGAKSGNVLRTNGLKLKPLVNTPAKAGLAAGGAGLTGGALLGRKSNN